MPTFTIGYGKFRVQDWLFSLDIPLEAKMTYIVLATCSGGTDHTWVSQAYLADRLKVSKRTVQRYLKVLETAGLISRTWERLKGITRRVYHFLYDKIMEKQQETITHEEHREKQDQIRKQPPSSLSCEDENKLFINQTIEENFDTDSEGLDEIKNTPQWNEAKKILAKEEPRFSPIFNLLTSRMTDSGLTIEGPNAIVMRSIERNHRETIANALERAGCSTFSFGVQPIEIQQIMEKQFRAKELKATRHAEDARKKTADDKSAEMERLAKLPLKQQFELLVDEYPLKKSRWMALQVFVKMAKRNELPNITVLLQSIRNHKTLDASWNKDNGRWIPSLPKWLRERRWIDQPSG
jgi:DNA-binding MarR family transcriptional regulator